MLWREHWRDVLAPMSRRQLVGPESENDRRLPIEVLLVILSFIALALMLALATDLLPHSLTGVVH